MAHPVERRGGRQLTSTMPLYEYRCGKCGKRTEVIQSFSEKPLRICPHCGERALKKMMSAPAIQFKGSGWYVTDYAGKKGESKESSPESSPTRGESKESSSESSSDKRESKEPRDARKREKSEKADKSSRKSARKD